MGGVLNWEFEFGFNFVFGEIAPQQGQIGVVFEFDHQVFEQVHKSALELVVLLIEEHQHILLVINHPLLKVVPGELVLLGALL
jgi:hypothetical protein